MVQLNGQINMDMLMFIVNYNEKKRKSKEVLRLAAEKGLHGGTIILGEGKVRSSLLRTLGIDSARREIVILVAPSTMAKQAFTYITEKSEFEKKKSGVALRIPLNRTSGISKNTIDFDKVVENKQQPHLDEDSHQLIVTIKDIGEGEEVLDIVERFGGLGGTVIHGRGAASYEVRHVFNMDIEPEKDVLMTIVPSEKTHDIINTLSEELEMKNKNTGVLFAVDLAETFGLFQ
ncbi:P-II family nitrogen regulator [Alkalibacterium iburiense]|uniref:P-II family nitrogen regulator n=1 Tax=Alkalibacterium iburiense TaxID=290589 RepID=A0ABN0X4B6_9LACT